MSLLKKKKMMSKGGPAAGIDDRYNQKGVHTSREPVPGGTSPAGDNARDGQAASRLGSTSMMLSKEKHAKKLSELKDMKGPTSGKSGFAEGGMAEDCPDCCDGMPCEMHGEQDDSHDMDMVSQVMSKRMSKGGTTEDDSLAGFKPNEFDELELNPPPMDNSSAGNEHGDSTLFEDAVSKVMMKRRKQHNPMPA